jgi:hypothetical protein
VGVMSNQPSADQAVDDKKKGAADMEVAVDPDDTNKKLRLGTELNPVPHHFSSEKYGCLHMRGD